MIGTSAYFDGRKGCCDCTEGMAEGIPLTPEILEKCGFVQTSAATFGNGIIGIYFGEGEYFYNHGKGKYLHQLQNLYFALTGEELNCPL